MQIVIKGHNAISSSSLATNCVKIRDAHRGKVWKSEQSVVSVESYSEHVSISIEWTFSRSHQRINFDQSIWMILFVWHNFYPLFLFLSLPLFFRTVSRSANIPKRIFNNRLRIYDWAYARSNNREKERRKHIF